MEKRVIAAYNNSVNSVGTVYSKSKIWRLLLNDNCCEIDCNDLRKNAMPCNFFENK